MSKTPVFSSERIESQERAKKILIPIAALLIIVGLVVAAAFIMNSIKGELKTGGEDTPYPYSWRCSNKGVMTLEIDHSADPLRHWIVLETDNARMLSAAAEKQPEDKSSFILTPSEEGRHNALFLLVDENGEAAARLDMLMEVTRNSKGVLKTDIVESSLTARQIRVHGGEGTNYPYSYRSDPDGAIELTVSGGAIVTDWICSCSNEAAAAFTGSFFEEGALVAYFSPGTVPGECSAKLSSSEGSVTISLDIVLNEDGVLLVSSDSIEGGTEAPSEASGNDSVASQSLYEYKGSFYTLEELPEEVRAWYQQEAEEPATASAISDQP